MTNKAGIFIVTHELLQGLLKIPKTHKVTRVYSKWEEPYSFNVVVEGPDMYEVFEGESVPRFTRYPESWLEKKED